MPKYFSDLYLYKHNSTFAENSWNFKTSRIQYLIAEFEIFLKYLEDAVAIDYYFTLQTEILPIST